MKMFITLGFVFLSSAVSAQTASNVAELKSLLLKNKTRLENIQTGTTKQVVSTMSSSNCTYRITSTDILLKIEDKKAIIYSKEKFQPQNTEACRAIGYTASSEQDYLYFEEKPEVELEIKDLDSLSSSIKKVTKSGNIYTLNIALTSTDENGQSKTENITNKYDITKNLFTYGVSSQAVSFSTTTTELPKTDLKTISLKSVIFCDNTAEDTDNDGPECVEGDYSDILF